MNFLSVSYSATFVSRRGVGCGGRIRTVYDDLRVMSPTSYQLLYPAYINSSERGIRTLDLLLGDCGL